LTADCAETGQIIWHAFRIGVWQTGGDTMLFNSHSQAQDSMQLSHSAKADYQGDERRVERRRRILKSALVQFNNGFGSLECVLRDMNANGAKVSMGQTAGIPNRFRLSVAGERTPIEAVIRWRTPRDIGVSFLTTAE
jgi:PilZ domain